MDFVRAYIEFMGDSTVGRFIIGHEGDRTPARGHGPGIHRHRGGPGEPAVKRLPAWRLKHVARIPKTNSSLALTRRI